MGISYHATTPLSKWPNQAEVIEELVRQLHQLEGRSADPSLVRLAIKRLLRTEVFGCRLAIVHDMAAYCPRCELLLDDPPLVEEVC